MKDPGDKESVITRYKEGPAILERAVAGLEESDLDIAPKQGGWTIRQIIHHIADGDDIWKIFIKAALGNERGEFFLDWYWARPQDEWVDNWKYANRSPEVSMDLLKACRKQVLQLLEQIPDAWDRAMGLRTKDGNTLRLSVGEVIKMQSDHVTQHADRILAIRRESEGSSGDRIEPGD